MNDGPITRYYGEIGGPEDRCHYFYNEISRKEKNMSSPMYDATDETNDDLKRDLSPVEVAHRDALVQLDILAGVVQSLEASLKDVLGPDEANEKSSGGEVDPGKPGSPLTNSFRDVTYRVEQVNQQLYRISRRLEL